MNDSKDAKALYNQQGESRVVYAEADEIKATAAGFTLSHADLPAAMKEYPKSLHQDGDRALPECIVRSDDEERAARAAGFKMIDKKLDKVSAERLGVEPEAEEVVAQAVPAKKDKKK